MTTTLNKFIYLSVDRCRPYFQLLHKQKDFTQAEECNKAFEELNKYLVHLPILSRPEKEEVLYAYIDVTDYAVSLVLARTDSGVQKHVYYVSKSLQKQKPNIYTLRVPSWSSYMPRGSCPITSKPILLLSSLSSPYKLCFGGWTIQEEQLSGKLCQEHLTSNIYLMQP